MLSLIATGTPASGSVGATDAASASASSRRTAWNAWSFGSSSPMRARQALISVTARYSHGAASWFIWHPASRLRCGRECHSGTSREPRKLRPRLHTHRTLGSQQERLRLAPPRVQVSHGCSERSVDEGGDLRAFGGSRGLAFRR